jgi:hypothetical protein
VAIVLISGIGLLQGCKQKETYKELDFQFALPDSWKVVTVERLDTDRDGDNEWVLLYTFDHLDDKKFVPVRCAIYDIAHREPKLPVIYPYHLQAPGWTYVGEGASRTSVSLQDVVTTIPGKENTPDAPEVVVQSKSGDGLVDRVSIYHWQDNVPSDLRKRTDPHEILDIPHESEASGEWYQCIGMFEGTIKVELTVDKVIVWDSTNDRSQLARVSTYEPKQGSVRGYLNADHQLIPPASTCLDFGYGMPDDITESPYPEKIVLAFQKSYASRPDFALRLMTPEAKKKWLLRSQPWIQSACVKRIRYGPPAQARSEVQSYSAAEEQPTKQTPVQEKPIETSIQTQIMYGSDYQKGPVEITWIMTQVDNAWKIADFVE